MAYDSMIFDLDGTMWSSAKNVFRAIKKMKEKHPEIRSFTQEDCSSTMGFSNEQTRVFYFNEFSLEKGNEYCKEFLALITEDLMEKGGEVYPSVLKTLRELKKKYRLFIVSNCGHGFVESFMAQTGTEDLFEDYEYCARTGLEKGGNISLIVKRNNLKNAVYVGDTLMDKKGAEEAGIDFIYAEYGFGKLQEEKSIMDFSDLLRI